MFLASNSTISVIPNETAESETNWSCILVNSIAERISKLCVYCVVLLGSFFGNIFITLIVYKHRDLRKTINYFILNMALSDLVFPLILLPLKITELVTGSQHWRISGITGLILCKFSYFASSASLSVSTQSLVWIAIDRFFFISDFMFFLSPVVNPLICLSFVESYRRGLKNLVCCFCGMRDNKRAKRERITLKRIRNLPGENWQGTSKGPHQHSRNIWHFSSWAVFC